MYLMLLRGSLNMHAACYLILLLATLVLCIIALNKDIGTKSTLNTYQVLLRYIIYNMKRLFRIINNLSKTQQLHATTNKNHHHNQCTTKMKVKQEEG